MLFIRTETIATLLVHDCYTGALSKHGSPAPSCAEHRRSPTLLHDVAESEARTTFGRHVALLTATFAHSKGNQAPLTAGA